jgi:hypothetical protein
MMSEQHHPTFWNLEFRNSTQKNEYRILITTPKANITGILIVKQINSAWRGTLINEFGLKVFDFVSTSKKCELVNVISFLDKWYIKMVISADIQYIMEIDNPDYFARKQAHWTFVQDTLSVNYKNEKELRRLPDGKIEYKNNKRALNYTLTNLSTYDSQKHLLQN